MSGSSGGDKPKELRQKRKAQILGSGEAEPGMRVKGCKYDPVDPGGEGARGTVVSVEHNVLMTGVAWEKDPTTGIETREEFEEVGAQVQVHLDRGPATALVKPRDLEEIDEASEVEVTAVEEAPEVVVVEDE